MKRLVGHHVLIVAAAAALFFTNLGVPRLWDRDEPRNAACTAEMLAADDWVVPVFNAELRAHKPVLLYWFMMTAYEVFGVGEFAARFWSAMLGVGTALVTYHLGRRLFDPTTGLWAALMLAPAMMFVVASRAATPDSMLVFFCASALLVYVLGTFRANEAGREEPLEKRLRVEGSYFPANWFVVAAMYGLMGLAVLTKGPVGLALPTAAIGMFLLIMRLPAVEPTAASSRPGVVSGAMRGAVRLLRPFEPRHFLRTCWSMRPITALVAAGVVSVPWYVWVGQRTNGAFLREFFLTHNLGRASNAMEGHDGPIFFYLIVLLIGFFPWSVFAGPTLIDAVGRIRRDDPAKVGLILAACWVMVWIGLFSLVSTKLPSYITPAYPGAALLVASFVTHWNRQAALPSPIWTRLSLGSLALVGAGLLVGLPLAASQFLPGEEWIGAIGLIPLAAAVACGVLLRKGHTQTATATFAAGAVAFSLLAFSLVTVRVDRHQTYDVLLGAIDEAARSESGIGDGPVGDGPQVAALACLEPSWVFYGGRPISELGPRRASSVNDYLAGRANGFVITTRETYQGIEAELDDGVAVLAETKRFLREGGLVVLWNSPRPDPSLAQRPSSDAIQR